MSSVKDEQKPKIKEENVDALVVEKSAALRLLQQYAGSESESEEYDEKNSDQKYRTANASSSSSSSSDSSDEDLDLNQIRKKLETSITDDDEDDREDGGTSRMKKKREPLKVKGEFLLEDLPPIQDLEIKVDENECLELGTISSIVEQLVLVEAYSHSTPLDIDSVLFLDKGQRVLGKIFDVIGQVTSPIYCVRFNSKADIIEKNIVIGQKVFCAPRTEYTSFVILQNIMGKGSDASWKNDVEVPENLVDYSDDEQERNIKKQSRQKLVGRRRIPNQNEEYSWNQANPNPYYGNYNFSQSTSNKSQF